MSSRYLIDILIFFTSCCNIYHFSHVIIMFSEVFKMWKSGKKLIAHPSSGRLEHSLAPFYPEYGQAAAVASPRSLSEMWNPGPQPRLTDSEPAL